MASSVASESRTLANFQDGMIVLSGSKTITRFNGMTVASTQV